MLASRLAALELADLHDDGVIDVVAGWEQVMSWAAGQQLVALAEFSRRRTGGNREFAADEVAPAAALTPRTADARLGLAEDLDGRLPAVLGAMTQGRISLAKAAVISEQTSVLAEDTARAVTDEVLPQAAGWTTGQLRHRLAKAVIEADPQAANARAEQAKQDRGVWLRRGRDGNACLDAVLDAYDGAAAFAVLDETAQAVKAAKDPEDKRGIGQIRSDVLLDLIFGRRHPFTPASTSEAPSQAQPETQPEAGDGHPGTPAAQPAPTPQRHGTAPAAGGSTVTAIVNVVVPLSTLNQLLADSSRATSAGTESVTGPGTGCQRPARPGAPAAGASLPGWIEGLGPIPGAGVRDLILDLLNGTRQATTRTGWRIVACHDDTGTPHAIGHTRYRPPPALQELVQLRDRTCRFPGCRRQATRCDIDHAQPHHDGGNTCDCNLQTLCRHHHRLKQHPAWTVTLQDGTSTWTSPTGRTYTSTPPPDWSPTDSWLHDPELRNPEQHDQQPAERDPSDREPRGREPGDGEQVRAA